MKGIFSYFVKKKDFTIGLCIVLFAVLMLILIPSQIPEATRQWGVIMALPSGHRFFPVISLIMILIGGAILSIEGFLSPEKAPPKEDMRANEDYPGFWITACSWAGYALLVMYIGYIVSTVLLLLFLLCYYGAKSWTKIIALTAGVTLFLYIVFVQVMKLPFPHKALFL